MRRRCVCGRIASTKKPCVVCGSAYSMWHCHDRAHKNHYTGRRALGYQNEDLGPCAGHVHPYDDCDHWNADQHEAGNQA